MTRAELDAHLNPMREDIREIRTDVKKLLLAQVSNAAVKKENRLSWQHHASKATVLSLILATASLVLSAILTIWR